VHVEKTVAGVRVVVVERFLLGVEKQRPILAALVLRCNATEKHDLAMDTRVEGG
jgi:hypothetical protein